jgi:LysM repeat protein
MALDRDDARLIAEELAKINKGSSSGSSSGGSSSSRGGGGGDASNAAVSKATGAFRGALENLPGPIGTAGKAFLKVSDDITAGMGAWQNLSKTGISFGNSIVDMQTAAKGARMDLGEFNDIIVQNKASLSGFGGSLDKGAKEFAKASKMMFDENAQAVDGLRNLGYANKDLNELLALQMGSIGASMASGKERDELAIKSTGEMAKEMDLMAKLTGKSREEQMDAQKKLAADQAYQAKLRIATANMSDKEAAEYKLKMDRQYAEANARGQGQLFKETFLYGTAVTKEAIGQVVAGGKSAIATSEQAKEAAKGNFEEAKKKSKEAIEEGAKLRNNAAQNQMIVQSGLSEAGASFAKQAAASQVYAEGIEKTRKEMEKKSGKPVSTEEATEEYMKSVEAQQNATDQSTKAVVNLDQRIKDAESAIMSGLVQPIVKQVGPSLKSLNENVLGASGAFKKFFNEGEAAGKGGFEAANTGRKPTLAETPTFVAAKGANIVNKAVGSRDGGTLEKTGSPVEPMDALVKIHKDETVLDPDSTKKLAQQLSESSKVDFKGITGGFGDAVKNMPKVDTKGITGGFGDAVKNMPKADAAKMPGIDLNKILTDIKTTVSKVEVSNWPKEITELKKLTPVQTQPAPAASKPAETKVEAKPAETKVEAKKEDNKTQADTALQEKILLNTRNMNEKDAAEYKKKIAEQYIKAEAAGVGKEFREFIVNGKELSKEAQDKIAAATIQSNKDTAAKSAEAESKKAEAKVEAYTVKAGDSLSKIAKAAGVSIADIMKANPQIKDPNKIFAGAKIEIPGIKKEEAKVEPKKEEAKVEPKKEEAKPAEKKEEAKVEPKKEEAKDTAPVVTAPITAPVGKPAEVKNPNSSESYKINGKEVDKKEFDQHMAANPELASLMRGIQPRAGGDAAAGGTGGGNSMTEAEAAMERMKAFQAQIGKDLEEGAANELDTKKEVVQQTRESINEELMVKQKAIEDAQNLTKKSEELAKQRESIEERLADRQARVAQLREIAGERDLTEQEKRHLTIAQDGLKRAENNLKRNLEDQAKLDEALGKVKKESNDKELKSVEQQARDKIELAGISNDEELEVAQIDAAAQAKFTHVDKDKIGEDIDSIVPTSAGATDAEMKAAEAQDSIDKAIEKQKEAQQKLNDLLMGASEEDIGEQYQYYAQQLDEANQNLAKVVDESMGDLIGTVEDSGTDFSDSLTQVSEDINEFSGVDEAIGGQLLENMDLGPKYSEQVSDDIDSSVPSKGATNAEMKATEAQDNIDKAIARQKEAQQKLNDLLMGASEEDIGEQYELYAQQLSEANENLANVVDESFGDLIGGLTESGSDFSDNAEKVMSDINDAIPGPTEAEMKLSAARDNVERAIEKQKEAEEKLASLSVDDDDFLDQYEMAAEALREANENVAKAMDESIKAYEETVADAGEGFNDSLTQVSNDINDALPDEFGGVDEAIGGQMLENMDLGPKYSEQASSEPPPEQPKDTLDRSKISFGSVTKIGPNGMPIMAAPKKDEKALPKVENPDDARENAKFKRQADESKKAAEAKTKGEEDKKGKPGEKTESKSLDDVVKTLEKLNTAMEKLIAVNNSNGSLLRDQIKATKGVASAAGGNLIGAH